MFKKRLSLVLMSTVLPFIGCGSNDTKEPGGSAGGASSFGGTTGIAGSISTQPGTNSSGGNSALGSTTQSGLIGRGGTSPCSGTVASGGAGNDNSNSTSSGITSAGGTSSKSSSTVRGGSTSTGSTSAGGTAGKGGSTNSGGSTTPTGPTAVVSNNNNLWKTATVTTTGTANITLSTTEYQTITGFGGAFNEKGWEILQKMTDKGKQALMDLFDPVNGARFAYGRIPIGASDYARTRYTLNDTAGDYEMTNFSIKRDLEMLIPYIKASVAVQPNLRLWGSAWTPPPWMKDNNAYDSGAMKSDAKTLNAYALYLAKFVEAYEGEGLKIEAVHIQNEPEELTNYPSCSWTPTLERDFVKILGPLFQDHTLNTEIWAGTYNKDNFTFPDTILKDATAKTYIKGIGVQWDGLGMLDQVSAAYPNLPLMQTETNCGNNKWESSFNPEKPTNDWAYGDFTFGRINSYIKAGVSSYMAWNMVLDEKGLSIDAKQPWPQNALLVVNSSSFALTKTPAYYAFRHFSGFVDPGAKRIGTSGSFTGDVLAFKNPDGRRVIVVRNTNTAAQNATVNLGTSTVSVSVPGSGWATISG